MVPLGLGHPTNAVDELEPLLEVRELRSHAGSAWLDPLHLPFGTTLNVRSRARHPPGVVVTSQCANDDDIRRVALSRSIRSHLCIVVHGTQ